MFDHLVESTSHKEDTARKGSFILVTAAIYVVLGIAFFIAGIIWYNAQLDVQNLELTALIAPVIVTQQAKVEDAPKPTEKVNINQQVDVRRELIADVTRTDLVPKTIESKASDIPPVRRGVQTVVGGSDSNAIAPIAPGSGTGTGIGVTTPKVNLAEEPPPPAPKPPPRAPISGGVLNGRAIRLVTPTFPSIARTAHVTGSVSVQVLIDETGNVVSASASSGHPLLRPAAVAAARASKFSPTKLSGQPVKVTGVIIYNFQ
jgi:protein TonB